MNDDIEHLLKIAMTALEAHDYVTALKKYQLAANKGSSDAEIGLALIQAYGFGVPANPLAGEKILLKVICNQLNDKKSRALAAHNLATLYFTGGENWSPNHVKGKKYEKLAAELGFPT
jgi:TPR repeat protein